jgi:large subunit ribosomal protein L24
MKFRKGDNVTVIRGKDRSKSGAIIRSLPNEQRVVVEGVNLKKRHVKARRAGQKGESVMVPTALPVSNVRIICKSCSKPARIGYKLEGGKMQKMSKSFKLGRRRY